MAKFKVGDLIVCLQDNPLGARINKGDLAKVVAIKGEASIYFHNHPHGKQRWAGHIDHFKKKHTSLVNK